jgi:hypothetical protein
MKPAKNERSRNAVRLGSQRGAQKRPGALPFLLLPFSVVVILGCVSIMPRSSQQEQTPATIQPAPVLRATQPAPATATIQPSPIPVTETQAGECARLNLTSQECASLGQHLFTLSGVVDGYCWYGTDDKTVTRDLLVTVSFTNDGSGKKATINNAAFTDCPASSRSDNAYTYDCIAEDANRHAGTILFVDNGFLNEGGFTNPVNKNCTWSESYKLP